MSEKILYAVCLEKRKRNGGVAVNIEYMHAEDAGEVFRFCMSSGMSKGTRVVKIAPVVGYWGEEDKDKNLIVSV